LLLFLDGNGPVDRVGLESVILPILLWIGLSLLVLIP